MSIKKGIYVCNVTNNEIKPLLLPTYDFSEDEQNENKADFEGQAEAASSSDKIEPLLIPKVLT